MADNYRRRQREPATQFTAPMQKVVVDTVRRAGKFIGATVHAATTEPTHVHVLVAWQHDRDWTSMRASVRHALTTVLNEQFGKRTWFSDSPSRKKVRDRDHFDYLMRVYLPKHAGVKWFRTRVA